MFNLEQAIADWRQQMLAAGIKAPVPLEELEIHLREEIEQQMKTGFSEQHAFEISISQLGQAKSLKTEFGKIRVENWNPPLAWAAWILFAGSFFLPSVGGCRGWQCAGVTAVEVFSPDFCQGNWKTLLWLLLDLSNLLMLASPFLLPRYSKSTRGAGCLQLSTFIAFISVWYFCFPGLTHASDRQSIQAGFFVWMSSFLLIFLSTVKVRSRKTVFHKEQYV
jgi:hypothetical protein